MAENNSVKDNLAFEQKKKYEDKIKETIKELKTGETTTIGGMEITNYGGQATIKIEGIDITFGIVDKNGNFTYSRENFVEAKKVLEEEGITLEELGLPDIEEWIDLEEQERDEMDRDERSLSNKMKEDKKPEREEPKREEPKEQDGDKNRGEIQKPTINRSYLSNNGTQVRGDRQVDGMRTFSGMLENGGHDVKEDEEFFFVPSENDANSYVLYAIDSKDNVREIPLVKTEKQNPNDEKVLVYNPDGSEARTQELVQILKVGNSNNGDFIGISKGKRTDTEIIKLMKDHDDNYVGTPIAKRTDQKSMTLGGNGDATADVRDTVEADLSERGECDSGNYTILNRLEELGVPDEINPTKDSNKIHVTEVEKFDDVKSVMQKRVLEYLKKEKGNQVPGFLEGKAKEIVDKVVDEGINFEAAKEQAFDDGKDKGGPTPDQKRNREG